MERGELIRRMVLNAICDDYENVDQIIFPTVVADCAKLGFTITRSDVVEALGGLVADGFAKAYLLTGFESTTRELPRMPSLDVIEENFETYFCTTKKGMEFHLADGSWWPFDEDGKPSAI